MLKNIRVIGKNEANSTQSAIDSLAEAGGGLCVILADVEKGPIFNEAPKNVSVLDLRYGGKLSLLSGNHPRKEGIWTQYSHLDTGLARNVVISDSITNDTPIENWKSEPHRMQAAPYGKSLTSEDYRHLHNHYQNFLSEVYNFSDTLNGVAIWGDSGAFVPGAKSWGGFLSARSWPVRWQGYTPANISPYTDEQFDAALVGLEIDVLNAGCDWGKKSDLLPYSMAKVGLLIVGFGSRNTAAVEIRTEDTDDPSKSPTDRRGAWNWGIIIRNALHENSTLLLSENGHIRRGVDLSLSTFREGALLITSAGPNSGIVFDLGKSGEVYADKDGTLVIKGGSHGLRMETETGEFLSMSSEGQITMSEKVKESFRKALDIT